MSVVPPECPPADGPAADGGWRRTAGLVAAGACAILFLWRVRSVLPPFLIAFFLASLLDPVVTRHQRRGVSRVRAVATIYALVFLLIVLAAIVVVPQVLNQMNGLANKASDYGSQITRITDQWYRRYQKPLSALGVKSNPLSATNQNGAIAAAAKQALITVKDAIQGFAGQILWLIIIPLSLFYFLMDYRALRAKLISFAPPAHQPGIRRMSEEVVEVFSAYFRSLAVVCVCYGIAAVVLFYLLGLHYALFLGLAAGVLYAVPYIGPAVAICTAGIVALTVEHPVLLFLWPLELPSAGYALLVVALFVGMHLSFDYGITPRVVGGSVGLHPLVNVFALMCGATLFGIWGMLLAVPVAASVRILLIYFFPKLAEPVPEDVPDPID
ncbi:MAG: AI-2E family transporter [Chthonomonadales bacterium]